MSSNAPSIGSAVAIPVKNEPVKLESVKSDMKSRTATHSGSISQRYPIFAEGVKKQGGSAKSGSVKSAESSAGSASQRSGRMALPVGNEPFEGPSPGGSTTSSARRARAAIKTPTELRSVTSSLNDFQIGSAKAASLSSSSQPSVVSVRSSRKSAK